MASQPSDPPNPEASEAPEAPLEALSESIRRGDWQRANRLIDALMAVTPPAVPSELARYLEDLRKALTAAKASRSHLAYRLNRIRAAAKFLDARKSAAARHDFADSADF